jgi:hypothetical protein
VVSGTQIFSLPLDREDINNYMLNVTNADGYTANHVLANRPERLIPFLSRLPSRDVENMSSREGIT